jgi:hypothetical protein
MEGADVITVRQLIVELQRLPQDAAVLLSSDEEGNSHRHLSGIDPRAQYKDTAYGSVEIGLTEIDDDLKSLGFTDADVMKDGKPGIILI